MTNEEAYNIISEFCFTGYGDNKKPSAKLFNAIRELVCEVHESAELRDYESRLEKENTKLKAEIEQLKESRNYISEANGSLVKINDKQDREITKLKDEIEQYKSALTTWNNANNEMLKFNQELKDKIEQLKSELEQSIKLPCKVGDVVYAHSTYFGILAYEINSIHICCGISFEAIASRNDDMLDSFDFDIEDIGKTIFLTREEAEQSLKGQV